jgi:ferrous-iron efflux pump FieF
MTSKAPEAKPKYRPHFALVAGAASLLTVVVLIGAKGLAYWHSGSASVFGSLMDSIVDATGSAMNFLAIHLSLKPADRNHRSGHGKIEGLAALLQALLILIGGAALLYQSVEAFLHPQVLGDSGLAAAIMLFSIVVSFFLVSVQRHVLKHAPSLAVESDQVHYSMDILVNIGVIAVLLMLHFGAPRIIDPVFAVIISGYLAVTAKNIAKGGLDMLLDRELSAETRAQVLKIIRLQTGVMGVHDLRTSQSGMRIFIAFDIEADEALSLRGAHDIARHVEMALLEAFPNADIMIHVDPHGDIEDSRHQVDRVHAQAVP